MKKIVPQGKEVCVNGLWYNQGQEYESDGEEADILPVEVVKQKNKLEKKEEG